jgi:hypothetical protein
MTKIKDHNKKELKPIDDFIMQNIDFEIEGHTMFINDDPQDSRHKRIIIDLYGHNTPMSTRMKKIFDNKLSVI